MTVTVTCNTIASVTYGPHQRLRVELDMDQAQMLTALKAFLAGVSDQTWSDWQAQINTEIYGVPA